MVAARSRARSAPCDGFTLVELMVALLVGGAAVAGAYGMVSAAADMRAALARARAAVLPGAAARDALTGWLAAAAVFPGGGSFAGRDLRSGPVEMDEMAFAVADGGTLYPGPHRVRLWVERSPRAAHVGLVAELTALRGPDAGRADTLVLAAEAGGLAIRHHTTVEASARWVDGWPPSYRLPDAVELRVLPAPERAADPRGDGLPDLLRLPIAVPLRTDTNTDDAFEPPRPAGLRTGCPAVGAGAGLCAGD